MAVLNKELAENILGGNGGVLVFDFTAGYINGKIGATGVKAAVVSTIVKSLAGAGMMALSTKVNNTDAENFVAGFGAGPIMTIANDWYKAAYGMDIGTAAGIRANARTATPRAPVRTPVRRIGATTPAGNSSLSVGVGL